MADRGSIYSLDLEQALATLRALGTTVPTPLGCHLPSEEPTRISSNGGLQSHGGHFRDSTDTLAARAVMWPRPCLSGLADPAEEQRTQKTGSLAGSGRVACKPLLSQKSERSQAQPPPLMECVLKAHILLSSRNMSPRVAKSKTGAWSWAPHSPRDPAGTQLEPSLGLGDP